MFFSSLRSRARWAKEAVSEIVEPRPPLWACRHEALGARGVGDVVVREGIDNDARDVRALEAEVRTIRATGFTAPSAD
jgi:hypothetical protein